MKIGLGVGLGLGISCGTAGSGGSPPPPADLAVALTSPAGGTVLPVNVQTTISGTCSSGTEAVEVYLSASAPLGAATIVGGTWSLAYTPGLTDHGSYNIYAVATRGGESLTSATVALSVSAVALRGTWGVYFDMRLLPNAVGAAVSTPIASLEGALSATPVNGTSTVVIGQGGRKELDFVAANANRFSTPLAHTGSSQPWTMALRGRITIGSRIVCGFGNPSSSSDYIDIGFTSGNVVRVLKDTLTDASVDVTATADVNFDPFTLIITHDGTQFWTMLNGVWSGPFASNPTGAMSASRFAFGASARSSVSVPITGQLQIVAARNSVMTQADATALTAAWAASDLPAVAGAAVMCLGDSITKGNVSGGFRKGILDHITAQSLAIDLVGPNEYGTLLDNEHAGYPGEDMASLTARLPDLIGTGSAFPSVELLVLLVGTNDAYDDSSTMSSDFSTFLEAVHTRLVATTAAARICVVAPPPINSTNLPAASARINAFVTALPGLLDTFDTAHPTHTVFRASAYQALGASWNSTDMADDLHPSTVGYPKIANDSTYGIVAAISAHLAAIG